MKRGSDLGRDEICGPRSEASAAHARQTIQEAKSRYPVCDGILRRQSRRICSANAAERVKPRGLSTLSLPLARHQVLHTTRPDEAIATYARLTTPVVITTPRRSSAFDWRYSRVAMGPLVLSSQRTTTPFAATTPLTDDMVMFTMAVSSGRGRFTSGDRSFLVERGRTASIGSPAMPIHVALEAGYQTVSVMASGSSFHDALATMMGGEVRPRIRFEPRIAIDSGEGASLARLVEFLIDEASREQGVTRAPLVAARMADAFLFGLLAGQPHNHSERMRRGRPAEPHYVSIAAAYMDARKAEPIRMAEVAAAAGVTLRSLQLGFRKHRGVSPMAFLRGRRLELARTMLLAGPDVVSVTEVALACGFEHVGRFSIAYRARFGERPSETVARIR